MLLAKDLLDGIDLERVSCTRLTDRTAHISYLRVFGEETSGDETLDTSSQTRLRASRVFCEVSRHTVAEGELTSQSRIVANSADRYRSTEGREVACRATREAIGDDCLGVDLLDATDSLLGEEGRRGAYFLRVRYFVIVFALEGSFCFADDASSGYLPLAVSPESITASVR